jgi:2-polyprenyl-3-methyl-5-hydroxy-6-metoxy-1,4-benzoquinol methylase
MKSLDLKCPLCHSSNNEIFSNVLDVEYFSISGKFEYRECDDCNCIFLKNPPLDKLNDIYPNNYYSIDGPHESQSFLQAYLLQIKKYFDLRLFAKYLKGLSNESLSCLDVGGGSGWMMNLVRQSDSRVTRTVVVDINEESRRIAEGNGHEFICSNIEAVNLTNQFDFILLLNLIEHVADPALVLSKLNLNLKSGGLILIKTPNTKSLGRKIFQKRYWGGCHAPRHWILFDKENFTSLAENCGFSILRFSYTQGASQWAASIIGSFRQSYPSLSSRTPLYKTKFASFLMLFFAVFDYLFLPLFRTDQMIFLLQKQSCE